MFKRLLKNEFTKPIIGIIITSILYFIPLFILGQIYNTIDDKTLFIFVRIILSAIWLVNLLVLCGCILYIMDLKKKE